MRRDTGAWQSRIEASFCSLLVIPGIGAGPSHPASRVHLELNLSATFFGDARDTAQRT